MSLRYKLRRCIMAEGGGIGPRSEIGTAAYKATPSSQLDTLRLQLNAHHGLTRAPVKRLSQALLFSPDATVSVVGPAETLIGISPPMCLQHLMIDNGMEVRGKLNADIHPKSTFGYCEKGLPNSPPRS